MKWMTQRTRESTTCWRHSAESTMTQRPTSVASRWPSTSTAWQRLMATDASPSGAIVWRRTSSSRRPSLTGRRLSIDCGAGGGSVFRRVLLGLGSPVARIGRPDRCSGRAPASARTPAGRGRPDSRPSLVPAPRQSEEGEMSRSGGVLSDCLQVLDQITTCCRDCR